VSRWAKDAVTCSAGRSSESAIGKAGVHPGGMASPPIHSHLKVTLHNLAQKSESLRHDGRRVTPHHGYGQSDAKSEPRVFSKVMGSEHSTCGGTPCSSAALPGSEFSPGQTVAQSIALHFRNELVRLYNEQTEFYKKGGES
jgi:hypothetical protein